MATRDELERRFDATVAGGGSFQIDDVTADGTIALDDDHTPNAANSWIGGLIAQAHRRGDIAKDGTALSRSASRRGALVNRWRPTPQGVVRARGQLDTGRAR